MIFVFLNILNFLNANNGAFSVILSTVLIASTIAYVIYNRQLVQETKKLRLPQQEPRVAIIFEPDDRYIMWINLKIKNVGVGPAKNITFKIKTDFEYLDGFWLSNTGFAKRGINYLAPNQEIKFFFTNLNENKNQKMGTPIVIDLSYNDSLGNRYAETFKIDFNELEGLFEVGEKPIEKISKSLKNIENNINEIVKGSKLQTVNYTLNDIKNERKELQKKWTKLKERSTK